MEKSKQLTSLEKKIGFLEGLAKVITIQIEGESEDGSRVGIMYTPEDPDGIKDILIDSYKEEINRLKE